MFKNLSRFINSAKERRFNDALMNVIILEILLKNRSINEELILPRYYNIDLIYNGQLYERSAMIKDLVPKKALAEIKVLIEKGSELNFENKQQIKNWIASNTQINDCSLAVNL